MASSAAGVVQMNYDPSTKTISMTYIDAIHCGLDMAALTGELLLIGEGIDVAKDCEKIVVRMR